MGSPSARDETRDPDAARLFAAGWWRAVNGDGEERWIDPGTPGWANDRAGALELLDMREEWDA